jgi:hypothetical protein
MASEEVLAIAKQQSWVPVAVPDSPAMASRNFKAVLNQTPNGDYAAMSLSYPKRNFPSATTLGLQAELGKYPGNMNNIFPFKDNNLASTEIEVPTTILVLEKETRKILLQTNKFLLQTISKPRQERFQIIETFGDPSVYFYGDRTRVYTIQGLLMDAENAPELGMDVKTAAQERAKGKYYWATAFQDFYENFLTGTKLKSAVPPRVAVLYVNNSFIEGYPIQLVVSKESMNMPQAASFQMTWVIEKETLLTQKFAEHLYMNNRITETTAAAINTYITAAANYEKAYKEWNTSAGGVTSTPALATAKDAAAQKVVSALSEVKVCLDNDAKSLHYIKK